jgi:mono/diheme cytochrome c family protein
MSVAAMKWAVVLVLAASASSVAALAEEPADGGKRQYLRYCSACHGPEGKGDGIVSGSMRPKPPDLTVIAKRNKGDFPAQTIAETIDGRATPRAHGDPDMPVWGEVFKLDLGAPPDREAAVQKLVLQITEYVRSIQVK